MSITLLKTHKNSSALEKLPIQIIICCIVKNQGFDTMMPRFLVCSPES